MHTSGHHHAHVDAFLSPLLEDAAATDRLIGALDLALATLWRRARPTLGDVTIAAILDRVLYTTVEQYPALWSLELLADGLRVEALRERANTIARAELVDGVRFLLVEFLTVLGHLTAEILTPALHAELAELARHQTHARADVSQTDVVDHEGRKGRERAR